MTETFSRRLHVFRTAAMLFFIASFALVLVSIGLGSALSHLDNLRLFNVLALAIVSTAGASLTTAVVGLIVVGGRSLALFAWFLASILLLLALMFDS